MLEEARKRQDDPRLRVRLADYLTELERFDEALLELQAVLQTRPNDQAVLQRIAAVRARKEKP